MQWGDWVTGQGGHDTLCTSVLMWSRTRAGVSDAFLHHEAVHCLMN